MPSSETINKLKGVLFIVRAGSDIIEADFMHTKRTNFPTKMKIGKRLEELKQCTEMGTFLLSECSPVRKTNMFENADLHRMKWRKRYFDVLSCYRTKHTFIWRTGEHHNLKI